MKDASRLIRALRALLDAIENPEHTAPSSDTEGCKVLPNGAPVLDRAVSHFWRAFPGVADPLILNPPEAHTLDARRLGAVLRVRRFTGERRTLPEREGDTPEEQAARAQIGVWVRGRVETGTVILPAVAEAVRDALDLLSMDNATEPTRAVLPKREATGGNAAARALTRFLEVAIHIRDDANKLAQWTKPDTPERENSEPYLHRLGPGNHYEERVHPGSDELYTRAESLRALRVKAKAKAAAVSRALAVEVEDRCQAVLDAALRLTGNLRGMRFHSAEFTQAWSRLNETVCDAIPVVEELRNAEPGGDAALSQAEREEFERLRAGAKPGAQPRRKANRRTPAAGERLTDDESKALDAVRTYGNPHAAAVALDIKPGTLDYRYKNGLAKLPPEYRAQYEPKRTKAGKRQALPTDRRGNFDVAEDDDRRF